MSHGRPPFVATSLDERARASRTATRERHPARAGRGLTHSEATSRPSATAARPFDLGSSRTKLCRDRVEFRGGNALQRDGPGAKRQGSMARNRDVRRPSALGPRAGTYRFSSQALFCRRPEVSPRSISTNSRNSRRSPSHGLARVLLTWRQQAAVVRHGTEGFCACRGTVAIAMRARTLAPVAMTMPRRRPMSASTAGVHR